MRISLALVAALSTLAACVSGPGDDYGPIEPSCGRFCEPPPAVKPDAGPLEGKPAPFWSCTETRKCSGATTVDPYAGRRALTATDAEALVIAACVARSQPVSGIEPCVGELSCEAHCTTLAENPY